MQVAAFNPFTPVRRNAVSLVGVGQTPVAAAATSTGASIVGGALAGAGLGVAIGLIAEAATGKNYMHGAGVGGIIGAGVGGLLGLISGV